jgi:hypothetical protein
MGWKNLGEKPVVRNTGVNRNRDSGPGQDPRSAMTSLRA